MHDTSMNLLDRPSFLKCNTMMQKESEDGRLAGASAGLCRDDMACKDWVHYRYCGSVRHIDAGSS